jgi:GT2 family glycosyltransferase
MPNAKITILVPNYKTVELTKLCLRLLRKYTSPDLAIVTVIDNDSNDSSLEYLRSLNWIQLIERRAIPGESPALSHARALDQALETVTTPYVLSIHTDTLVKNSKWLPYLLSHIENDPQIAGVGSWKLEYPSLIKSLLKSVEDVAHAMIDRLKGKKPFKEILYLRSHCALYRTDLLRRHELSFAENDEVAGKAMHQRLISMGYKMKFLSSEQLYDYVDHINHATMFLNNEFNMKKKRVAHGMRRMQRSLSELGAAGILLDDSLDR